MWSFDIVHLSSDGFGAQTPYLGVIGDNFFTSPMTRLRCPRNVVCPNRC